MRELRIQASGRPLRVFYLFDVKRQALLLISGDKTSDNRFYKRIVATAEQIYERYIAEQAGSE